ncbi:permease [Haladaptatus sp. W1]|uniref:permease n=1 Tax=Haladaptatus sp. W1 TaxID=1897478 RepID=UPI000849AD95|nr:permease [Haladaptatus sp. W1]ODR82663.1 permease [Haladaptatus sp. W1]
MNARAILFAVASAVTTVLLAGAATIELLSAVYGESPGVGMLGLVVGLVVGVSVGAGVVVTAGRFSGISLAALVAYATFGVAFLTIAGLRYVNVPGADALFTFPVHFAVSLLLALAVAVLTARGFVRGVRPSV